MDQLEPADTRSLENPSTSLGLDSWLMEPLPASSIVVTPHNALSITAVYAAINAIATPIASLPFEVFERLPSGGKRTAPEHPAYDLIFLEPNPDMTAFTFRQTLMNHVLTWGNGYAEIVRNGGGVPQALWLLPPDRTEPDFVDGRLVYRCDQRVILAENVIHVAGLGFDGLKGYSPITLAREALGLAKAAEVFGSSLFGNGATPNGILEYPGKLDGEAVKKLRESFNRQHQGPYRANRVAVLEHGVKWVSTSISAEDYQFLLTRQFQVIEIARLFSVPPHKLGDMTEANYSTIEEQNLDFYTTSLMPWLEKIEQEFSRKLFTRQNRKKYFVSHNMNALLRGRAVDRIESYSKGFQIGMYTINDLLGFENLNPIGELGDKRFVPVNLAELKDHLEPVQGEPQAVQDQPQQEPDPEDDPITEDAPDGIQDALEGILDDAVGRAVRREVSGVRKALKRGDDLSEFYRDHQAFLVQALSPALRAIGVATRRRIDPETVAADLCRKSLEEVMPNAGDDQATETLLWDWDRNKAQRHVEHIMEVR